MILSGYQDAAFNSFYTSRPFTSLASLSTPATDEVTAIHLSSSTSCLRMAFFYCAISASFYTIRGHHNGYLTKHRLGAFPGSTTLRHAHAVQVGGASGQWMATGDLQAHSTGE